MFESLVSGEGVYSGKYRFTRVVKWTRATDGSGSCEMAWLTSRASRGRGVRSYR